MRGPSKAVICCIFLTSDVLTRHHIVKIGKLIEKRKPEPEKIGEIDIPDQDIALCAVPTEKHRQSEAHYAYKDPTRPKKECRIAAKGRCDHL